MKDKTLLQALILGLGQVGAKIISLILIFRFANDLGKSGMSLYAYAYVPFSIFADLSSFGLIPGTSKLVARLLADGKEKEANYLLKKGTLYSLVIGMIFFFFLLFFNKQILSISLFDSSNNENFEAIRLNILFASISLFVIPLNNFLKGFLQGHLIMYPSCISILVENITKLLAYIILVKYFRVDNLIHAVFLIYFLGYFVSLLILFCCSFRFFKAESQKFLSIKNLLKTCIPFGIATMFFTIYQLIDSITLSILLPKEGYYTAYMYETIRLIFFPIVIAQALGGAINPKINYLFHEDKVKEAKTIALKCTTMIIYILLPLMLITKLFSKEIYSLFYSQENGSLILYQISSLIIFFGLYKVLIGLSLGLPKGIYIVIATLISSVAKTILNCILIPKVGYQGAIYATIIAISICIMVAYYVLSKKNINLFFKNIKALIVASISLFISTFLVVIFRVCFSLNGYPDYYSIVLYSILILGIYYIFLKIIKQTSSYCIK